MTITHLSKYLLDSWIADLPGGIAQCCNVPIAKEVVLMSCYFCVSLLRAATACSMHNCCIIPFPRSHSVAYTFILNGIIKIDSTRGRHESQAKSKMKVGVISSCIMEL